MPVQRKGIPRPAIPDIDPAMPQNVAVPLRAMKEAIEISHGVRNTGAGNGLGRDGWKRRSVTLGMLIKLQIITEAEALSVFQDE